MSTINGDSEDLIFISDRNGEISNHALLPESPAKPYDDYDDYGDVEDDGDDDDGEYDGDDDDDDYDDGDDDDDDALSPEPPPKANQTVSRFQSNLLAFLLPENG